QSEAYLLPEDLKTKRQDEIIDKEKEVKELQKKRFGSGGDLEKKREDLLKPIQDKVYSAIEKYATAKGYSIIFDKSGESTIIYANAKSDVSDDILKQMGYTAKQ
ncbi:MAG: OmpH family outer membrane protein, partial [Bacteroidales bacterium]|nr:OmpH family outer membrane protein [Bacteroidales bacterium]